jgi:NADPH:quinone reductase
MPLFTLLSMHLAVNRIPMARNPQFAPWKIVRANGAGGIHGQRECMHASGVDVNEIASSNRQIAESMTAIAITGKGGPEVLVPQDMAVPVPAADEVLLRVHAAGVNRPDVMQRAGLYPPPPGAPDTPGLEVAGEVVAVGDNVDPSLLDTRQCALVAGGGYAQYCVAKGDHCLPVPDGLPMEQAAALPETLFTVWSNVFERGLADEGEWLLVHGGTSGIGTMAIKLAILFGLKIIVTCGGAAKCDAALAMGAHHAVDYKSQDFVEEVKRITGGRGVDVVLDMISGDYVARNIACMADDARHVTIAVQGGVKAEIPMHKVLTKRLTLTGSTLRPRSDRFKAGLTEEIRREVWPFVESGQLRPAMDSTFPLERAADAHARMDQDHIGKIVLTV